LSLIKTPNKLSGVLAKIVEDRVIRRVRSSFFIRG